jgi:hypothetical protein
MTELLIFVLANIVGQTPVCPTFTTLIIAVLGEHLPGTIDGGARQHHDGYAGVAAALSRPKLQ